jgi:GT2 family glycosyltransferase
MKLSIIIVNWKTPKITLKCVNSIYKYKPKYSFEVVVIDNGSGDDSRQKLKHLGGQAVENYKLVLNKENLGFARANNIGIRKSKGEYKLLLNSDTKVTEGAIDKLIEFAKSHKDAGVVGARLLNKDGSIQDSVFRFPNIWRNVEAFWLGKKVLDKYSPNETGEVDALVGAAFLITSKAIKKAGLLNARYFMYFEDIDYCRKVRSKNLKVYYLAEAEVYHLHGASGKKVTNIREQWKRLIPSSKIYYGTIKYYLVFLIQRTGDIFRRRVLRR